MCEWKECKLGDVAEVIDSLHKTPKYALSGYPMVRVTDVKKGRLNLSNTFKVDYEIYDEFSKKHKPQIGDVIFTRVGSYGNSCIVKSNEEFCLGQNTVMIVPKCDPDFLYYFLNSPDGSYQIESSVGGSTQPTISLKSINNFDILLPPLPEQRAIASVLSSLDDKIDLLHRQNQTLEAMAETLFRQWFVEGAEEGWEATTLEQHTEVFRGLSYKGSGLTESGLGIPMHNLNSVYEGGGYKSGGIKFYSGEYKERHLICPGNIIVTNTEQGHEFKLIGFPAIVPDSFGNTGLFSQHIYKIVLKKQTDLSSEFIYYLLMSHSVREQIISATNGSTVNMLAIDGLQRPKFKLPPKNKMIEFTAIVSAYWKKTRTNTNQIRTLEKLRDTLLPKLMSGEVRVQLAQGEAAV